MYKHEHPNSSKLKISSVILVPMLLFEMKFEDNDDKIIAVITDVGKNNQLGQQTKARAYMIMQNPLNAFIIFQSDCDLCYCLCHKNDPNQSSESISHT